MNAMKAVILAGGRGRRLAPYTSVLPKPLMPLGDRSVLEVVIDQLARHGFDNITLCVGYLSHLIRAVLDNGATPAGVTIEYVREHEALGTAGPLRLIDDPGDMLLVMNGDVVTTLDFSDLVAHHRGSGNLVTIASHRRTAQIDYGILDVGDGESGMRQVLGYREKPELDLQVSMGIYVIERRALEFVPEGYFDFPQLVLALLDAGERVGAYVYDGYWLDIGRFDDYERAVADWTAAASDATPLASRRANVEVQLPRAREAGA